MAELRVFGSPSLRGDSGALDLHSATGKKALALLTYLAADPGKRYHTREDLGDLLWPTLPPEPSDQALDEVLGTLRSLCGTGVIEETQYRELFLTSNRVSSDLWAYRGAVRMSRYQDALSLYRGPFLEGFVVDDAPEFMDWLGQQRTKLARAASMAAWREFRKANEAGDLDKAADLIKAACTLSPNPGAVLDQATRSLREIGAHEDADQLESQTTAQESVESAQGTSDDAHPVEEDRWSRILGSVERLSSFLEGNAPPAKDGGRSKPRWRWIGILATGSVAILAVAWGVPKWPGLNTSANQDEGGVAAEAGQSVSPEGARTRTGQPPPAPHRWVQANWHFDRGNYGKAAEMFAELTGDSEYSSEALSRWIQATSALKEEGTLDGLTIRDSGTVRDVRILLAISEGRWSRVRALMGEGGGSVGPLPQFLVAWADGDVATAYQVLEGAATDLLEPIEGPLPNALVLSVLAERLERPDESAELASRGLREVRAHVDRNPEDPWGYRNLAVAHLLLGQPDEALDALITGRGWATDNDVPRAEYEIAELLDVVVGSSDAEEQSSSPEALAPWSGDRGFLKGAFTER